MSFKTLSEQIDSKNKGSIDDTVEQTKLNDTIDYSNPDDLRKLYHRSGEITDSNLLSEDNYVPKSKDLEMMIKDINKTHRQFQTFQKIERSPIYKAVISIGDFVVSSLGYESPDRDLFSLFTQQQKNLKTLNNTVSRLASAYKENQDDFSGVTIERIDQHSYYLEKKEVVQNELEAARIKASTAYDKLISVSKNEDPIGYNQFLKDYVTKKNVEIDKRFEWEILCQNEDNLNERVAQIIPQEKFFRLVFNNTRVFSERVSKYLEELDDHFRYWSRSRNISEGISYVVKGIDVQNSINKELNKVFKKDVKNIIREIGNWNLEDTNIEHDIYNQANRQLESLSEKRTMNYIGKNT